MLISLIPPVPEAAKMTARILFLVTFIFLTGCATTSQNSEVYREPLGDYYWENPNYTESYNANLELTKSKARCTVEKLQLPIPAPSCYQPPKQDCSGLTGFAAGFCRSFVPPVQCDYSAVNAVKKAQEDIWNACMAADQWVLRFSTDGYGGNTEGGLFSPFIAKTPSGHYSIKLDSMQFRGDLASAIVRKSCQPTSAGNNEIWPTAACKPHQGFYAISILKNEITIDQISSPIEPESSIPLIFKYIKQRASREE